MLGRREAVHLVWLAWVVRPKIRTLTMESNLSVVAPSDQREAARGNKADFLQFHHTRTAVNRF